MKKDLGRVDGGLARDFRNTINSALGDVENNFKEADTRLTDTETSVATALATSNQAVSKATNVQSQVDALVIGSNTSPAETVQARVDEKNRTFDTVKQRIDTGFTEVTAQLAENEQKNRNFLDEFTGTQMVAHKGVMNLAPENSIPAFELAAKYGYKFIEMDVSVTSDGALVINHDSTVDAMTDGTGLVSSMTLNQIKTLNIDNGANISIYEGTKICTLEDVLKISVKHSLIPFVELKNIADRDRDCLNIYNLLKKYGLSKRCVLISYNRDWLEWIRSLDSQIFMAVVSNPWDVANVEYVKNLGNAMLCCDRYSATLENVQYCHDNGIKMAIYSPTGTGSIDLLAEQKTYISRGVDFIITGSLI